MTWCLRSQTIIVIFGGKISLTVVTLDGSVNLGEWGLNMSRTEVSCNSQLYSEHQTIYTLRVKKGHGDGAHL